MTIQTMSWLFFFFFLMILASSSDAFSITRSRPVSNTRLNSYDDEKGILLSTISLSSSDSENIKNLISKLVQTAEDSGNGQDRSEYITGDWSCIFNESDLTRSSPFFTAFRKCYADNEKIPNQIFSITDAIPETIKKIDFARMEITDFHLVSRVKVSTPVSSSIMTTRCNVIDLFKNQYNVMKLQVLTTKAEDNSLLAALPFGLGDQINEQSPSFPSGDVLEKIRQSSSEVDIKVLICDATIRVDEQENGDLFVYERQ